MYVAFDTLLRSLRRRGYDVTCVLTLFLARFLAHPLWLTLFLRLGTPSFTRLAPPTYSYVRNFTDVDDKIIRRASEARAPPTLCARPGSPLYRASCPSRATS